jgi:hypothetical protein
LFIDRLSGGRGAPRMEKKEKRQNRDEASIDPKLIERGRAQLAGEIDILQNWVKELEASGNASPEVLAARIAYRDMLASRKEMLSALLRQPVKGS